MLRDEIIDFRVRLFRRGEAARMIIFIRVLLPQVNDVFSISWNVQTILIKRIYLLIDLNECT